MDDRAVPSAQRAPRDPEELEAAGIVVPPTIAPSTRMGAVHLTVSDLDRSRRYYEQAIGLATLGAEAGRVRLGLGGSELLVLVEEPGARAIAGSTGLYHFALLVPSRAELARWLAHAARERIPLVGMADHVVSEAIYLSDPDGHGIEIYADRPRAQWEGLVGTRMTTLPLDTRALLVELDEPDDSSFGGLATGTMMGHIHLKVASVAQTIAFYRDLLGFGLMASLGAQAAFFAAGGYHHHIGANTWESAGGKPPAPGTAALRLATIALPEADGIEAILERLASHGFECVEYDRQRCVVDPSGIRLRFVVDAERD